MSSPRIIQKLISHYDNFKYKQPKYDVNRLYCGSIEQLLDIQSEIFTPGNYLTNKVQDFAIFYKKANGTYIHILSNKRLASVKNAGFGEYIAHNLVPFRMVYQDKLPIRLFPYIKVSKYLIEYLETHKEIIAKHNQENTK